MKKFLPLLLLAFGLNTFAYAQKTYIPDHHFEQALIDLGLDDVLDDSVNTASIDTVTTLVIQFKNISDLTGADAFGALEKLDVYGNQLTTLDLSKNTLLKSLVCIQNHLSTLNISKCKELEVLSCGDNQISSLDLSKLTKLRDLNCDGNNLKSLNVSNNPLLTNLSCQNNPITALDLTNNSKLIRVIADNDELETLEMPETTTLKVLWCRNNKLKTLNLSNNTALWNLYCFNNQLESLNLTNDVALQELLCFNNKLTSLDLSTNYALRSLRCSDNQINKIDASLSPDLYEVNCSNNQLTYLNVRNGKNHKMQRFDARNNPNLTCIQVDDAAWSTANWPNKDATATYSDCCNCNQSKTYIPDDHFEQALIDLGLDDVLDDSVNTASIDTVTKLRISFKNIADLTGIEAFISLKNLDCGLNQLNDIDLSKNTELTSLIIRGNKLTKLDITKNVKLKYLEAQGNQLTSLDVTKNLELTDLLFGGNNISSIDLSHNIHLKVLDFPDDPISNLNISNNAELVHLGSANNQLTSLDVSNNTALVQLYCNGNKLTNLDVSHNLALKALLCSQNQLTSLNVTDNTALTFLDCASNKITRLDVSHNTALNELRCGSNQLSSLNVKNGNNKNFTTFSAVNNPNLTCIQVDDAAWSTANWPNKDATATYSDHCSCCGADTDGDGVPDSMDDYPNDSTRAFNNYFPATGFGTLAFEDLWPGKGDYDFNDVVVGYQFKTVTNASNKVVEIIGTIVAKASGASMRNGFGFNLPDASATLCANQQDITVSGYSKKETYIRLNSNGLEKSQSKPTVIVFDDIFDILPVSGSFIGVNTNPKAPFVPFDTLTIAITPVNTHKYTAADFSLETWNPFIIVNHERGKEVHLPDHAPTDLADPSYFKTMDDDSDPATGKYYKTEHNQPWAIDVVSDYQWPVEKVNIGAAYLHFVKWAETSGAEFPDWYKDKPGYRNESNIYVVPAK